MEKMNSVFTYIKKGVFLTELMSASDGNQEDTPKDPDKVSKQLIENIH